MDRPSFRLPPSALSGPDVFAQIAALLSLEPAAGPASHQIGPGKRTIHSLHARIGTSRYEPHQGTQECARRRRQLGLEG